MDDGSRLDDLGIIEAAHVVGEEIILDTDRGRFCLFLDEIDYCPESGDVVTLSGGILVGIMEMDK